MILHMSFVSMCAVISRSNFPHLPLLFNWRGVFFPPFVFLKIPFFVKSLVTVACKCELIFLSLQDEKKRERGEGGEGKRPLQMLHNCTEQMNINVTVKLKWRKNVPQQQTVLELEEDRTCFEYEDVNAKGGEGSAPGQKCLPIQRSSQTSPSSEIQK